MRNIWINAIQFDPLYAFSVVGTSRAMSAPRAVAQLFRMAVSLEYFIPPATTRAGTAQRAIPTIAKHIRPLRGRRDRTIRYYSDLCPSGTVQ